jgi:hypothetical protein
MAGSTIRIEHPKMFSRFCMAGCTFTWQTIELSLNMASGAFHFQVDAFQVEVTVCMIKPGHAVQSVMASNTGITKIDRMLLNEFIVRSCMTIGTGRVFYGKPVIAHMAASAGDGNRLIVLLVPDQTKGHQRMVETLQ